MLIKLHGGVFFWNTNSHPESNVDVGVDFGVNFGVGFAVFFFVRDQP